MSVVRQCHTDVTGSDTDESSAKGIFGRKKKKKAKKDEGQTALVFSFSNADFTKNFNDLAQEALTSNAVYESNKVIFGIFNSSSTSKMKPWNPALFQFLDNNIIILATFK